VVIGKSSLLTKLQPHHLDQEAIRSRPSPSPYRLESHSSLVFERGKSKLLVRDLHPPPHRPDQPGASAPVPDPCRTQSGHYLGTGLGEGGKWGP
jgi:hypothetical protein